MKLFPALPRSVTRPASIAVLLVWAACMAVLVNRSYLQASSANLATDLARYGSNATWRGVYYRGEKIGFTVSQTLPTGDGFEIQEDGRLQMSLLGATTAAAIRTTARVDREFRLRSFDFSLDPGTGPIRVQGEITEGRSTVRLTASAEAAAVRRSASGESYGGSAEPSGEGGSLTRRRKADTTPRADTTLTLTITSPSGTRTEERELDEPPALSLNLARRLASGGLTPGVRHQWTMFDPATLRNAPVTIVVGEREVVRAGLKAIPAFRVEMEFAGLRTTAWVTDTGEVVREHSPLGLMTIREPAERARAMAVPMDVQSDLLRASAVVPAMQYRIDETREVTRLRLRIDGLDEARLSSDDLQGAGQTAGRGEIEIRDFKTLAAGPADPGARRHLAPEPLVESDAPEILDEAARAVAGVAGTRARAERLTRYVNALLEKKPTVSLPSAREVLRTKVGDCNEHTALYVAMARALGIPARIAVGLTFVRGAFYYHAWPEVYIDDAPGRGLWLPVDPTLNQFPADATHVRLARGGLDRQAAILPLIGRIRITVVDLELVPSAPRVLVGTRLPNVLPLDPARPRSEPYRWRRCR